jgi:hypothetical protein
MKKIFSLLICVVMLALCSSFVAPMVADSSHVSAAGAQEVATNANEARFLNMLNHNYNCIVLFVS